MTKKKVLFICTQNAARSQMAEAILRHEKGNLYEVFSAGIKPTKVYPYTLQVLEEIGINTRELRSKHLDELEGVTFDLVVTVCDRAQESCPVVLADNTIHKSFPDPAHEGKTTEEKLESFRRVRNEMYTWIKEHL